MASVQESIDLPFEDRGDRDSGRILAEDDDPFRPAPPRMPRPLFAIFLGGSLIFHICLLGMVGSFDWLPQWQQAGVVEIPVDLVSEEQAQGKGGSGQPGPEGKGQAAARENRSQGSGPKPEDMAKADPAKPAPPPDKPQEKPVDPPAEKPQPEAEKPPSPPEQAKSAEPKPEEKPAEKKVAEPKPAENKPPRPEAKPEPSQKEAVQKQPAPAPEPPKSTERKTQAAAVQKPPPQPRRSLAAPPPPAEPQQSREEARRALAQAMILPLEEEQNPSQPLPMERRPEAAPLPQLAHDNLSLAIAAPLPTDASGAEPVSYKILVFSQLDRAKKGPEAMRAGHATGTVTIYFIIDDEGQPQNITMIRSSGDPDIDAEGLAVVARAAPFPVPPAGAQREFGIDVVFSESGN